MSRTGFIGTLPDPLARSALVEVQLVPGSAPPEPPETGAMPTQNGLGLDQDDVAVGTSHPLPLLVIGK
jgi:hypothetical protein